MAIVQLQFYPQAIVGLLNKSWDWDTDVVKATLHTSTYTPAAGNVFFSDATNELAGTNGYTVGGKTLGSRSTTAVAANSWAQVWAGTTAYNVGELRRPTAGNGFVYRVAVAGTSSGSAPTWPTVIGQTVADGGVTWTCVGRNVVQLVGPALNWASPFDATFRHIVFWVDTAGASTTDPLIGYGTYSVDQVGGGGAFDFTPDAAGYFAIPVP
jgi:hypothetical protein